MKLILILFFVMCWEHLIAQQSKITGVVSVHNSEINTGRRQYIVNAQVEDHYGNAQPKVTDLKGKFELLFVQTPEKISVPFKVKKQGYQVVNPTPLSAITGQRDTVKISMAHPDSINDYRKKLYDIGKTQAEKRYEQLTKNLTSEIAKLKKNNLANADNIKKLELQISKLNAQRQNIPSLIQTLMEKYGLLNIDDSEGYFKEAFILFKNGYPDSALMVLNRADLKTEVKAIGGLRKDISLIDSLQRKRTKLAGEALQLKADLHKTRFEFDSTLADYELLMILDSNNIEYLLDYANFLHFLNRPVESMRYYAKALALSYSRLSMDSIRGKHFLARTQYNMGLVHLERNELQQAETTFDKALTLRKELAMRDPDTYEPYLANSYNALGKLYIITKKINQAEIAFREAITIRLRLAKSNPKIHELEIATLYNNTGAFYYNINAFSKADSSFQQALSIRKRLLLPGQQPSDVETANIHINLGNLYTRTKDYGKAQLAYQEASEIIKSLAFSNPDIYELELSIVENHLGALYVYNQAYAQADSSFQKALKIRKKLADTDPVTYNKYVAQTLNSLGSLYFYMKDFERAVTAYLEALQLRKRLAAQNEVLFEPDLANTHYNLGSAYDAQGNLSMAETEYQQALNIYKRQPGVHTFTYDEAEIHHSLAIIYSKKNEYVKTESAYREALNIYRKLAETAPQIYELHIARTLVELGAFYGKRKDYLNAELNFIEALNVYKRIIDFNPQSAQLGIASAKFNLATIYNYKEEYTKAESLLQEALEIYKRFAISDQKTYTPFVMLIQKELDKIRR